MKQDRLSFGKNINSLEVLEFMPDGILIVDKKGVIVHQKILR